MKTLTQAIETLTEKIDYLKESTQTDNQDAMLNAFLGERKVVLSGTQRITDNFMDDEARAFYNFQMHYMYENNMTCSEIDFGEDVELYFDPDFCEVR